MTARRGAGAITELSLGAHGVPENGKESENLIGGLFAVIALNFTISTSYSTLGSGDNPVNRLFGLAYLVLATSFAIALLVYRFDLARKWFGKYFSIELYKLFKWALPAATLTLALSVLFMAAS